MFWQWQGIHIKKNSPNMQTHWIFLFLCNHTGWLRARFYLEQWPAGANVGKEMQHTPWTHSHTHKCSDTNWLTHTLTFQSCQAQWACLDSTRGAICPCIGQLAETETQESLRMQYGSHVNHQPSSFPLKMSHWATGKWGQFVIHNLFKKAAFYRPFSEQWNPLWVGFYRFQGINKI